MEIEQNISVFRGMVQTGSDDDVPSENCLEMQDMKSEQGSVVTRCGFDKYTTSAFSGGLLGLFYYKRKNGTSSILSSTDNGDVVGGNSE